MTLTDRISSDKIDAIVAMLKIISHPVRLSIVDLLTEKKQLTVMDIQKELNIDQAVASHHLTLMEDKGVLLSQRIGRNKYVSLRFSKMKNIIDCMEGCCQEM